MTQELLALLVILPAVAASTLLTWWLTVKLVPPEPRRVAKWLYPAIVLILTWAFGGRYVADHAEQGDCVCTVCGRSTGLVSLGPLQFQVPVEQVRGAGESDVYEQAFPQSGPHHHQWLRVGCFSRGAALPPFTLTQTTCCTMIGAGAWFRDLPKLHDRELARSYAIRLARASVGEQHAALASFDSAEHGENDPEAAFADWRETWRHIHPEWP